MFVMAQLISVQHVMDKLFVLNATQHKLVVMKKLFGLVMLMLEDVTQLVIGNVTYVIVVVRLTGLYQMDV
jgi:hypothetical protein